MRACGGGGARRGYSGDKRGLPDPPGGQEERRLVSRIPGGGRDEGRQGTGRGGIGSCHTKWSGKSKEKQYAVGSSENRN